MLRSKDEERLPVQLSPTDVARLSRWLCLERGINGPLTTETDMTHGVGLEFHMDAGAMIITVVPRA